MLRVRRAARAWELLVFERMAEADWHSYHILTKRPVQSGLPWRRDTLDPSRLSSLCCRSPPGAPGDQRQQVHLAPEHPKDSRSLSNSRSLMGGSFAPTNIQLIVCRPAKREQRLYARQFRRWAGRPWVLTDSRNLACSSRLRANRAPKHVTPQTEDTRLRDVQIDPSDARQAAVADACGTMNLTELARGR